MCKWSDSFSKRVLIGRGLDHNSLETLKSQRKNASSDYSVFKARPSKIHWTKYNKHVILVQSDRSVSMTVRFHLFPFRTQKLSSLVPKIVRWKRRVKIGSRRLEQKTLQKKFWSVFLLSWNRFRRKQKGWKRRAQFYAEWSEKFYDVFVPYLLNKQNLK